ncbi:pyrophosphohydrolase [Intrasporangium chromatireducens Q5-1]|uniref:Pyrophosphohydrolase n=1 Tax=Intrasporangium chromatireducens Q5-1 TaxID=584657 RepID=W9GDM5_9MICO|nr:pyrophosphohydrolase [Intrasporangium chromatireducens Q5-1]
MGWPSVPGERGVAEDDLVVRAGRAGDGEVTLLVESAGEPVGSLLVHPRGDETALVTWRFDPAHEGAGVPHRAVRRAVDYCFTELGLHRVEALIPVADTARLRIAARAGLRREGLARGAGGPRTDLVRVARLASDPTPDTRDGFIGVLNANLPTKRVISQGVLRDETGRVLLCELTYKREWDLPGGVVDPWESPASALARELREELGLDLTVAGLLVVNWMPPWRGWDDACQFVFDLGVHDPSLTGAMTFEATEIAAVHWCTREQARPQVPDYLDGLLGRLERLDDPPVYLEGGSPL